MIIFEFYKSCEKSYQVLQVACTASEHAMKLKVHMINVYHHSTKLYRKEMTHLLLLALLLVLHTDSNKVMILCTMVNMISKRLF